MIWEEKVVCSADERVLRRDGRERKEEELEEEKGKRRRRRKLKGRREQGEYELGDAKD